MGRARPFVCALECVGMGSRWTARTRARVRLLVWPAWDGRLRVRPSALWIGRLRVRRLRAFDCSSVWRAWDGRVLVRRSARATATARLRACDCDYGYENMGMKRRLRTSDCLSVLPAWENSPVRLRLHDAWAWEAWAWKRHGAADGTSARACDGQDLVRGVCLAALVLRPFLLASNKAVEVAGVHCVRLNSCPSW